MCSAIQVIANFTRLIQPPNFQIYKYRVVFVPECMTKQEKDGIINISKLPHNHLFDGEYLFLPKQHHQKTVIETYTLPEKVDQWTSAVILHQIIGNVPQHFRQEINFNLIDIIDDTHPEFQEVLDLISRRIGSALQLLPNDGNYYDTEKAIVSKFWYYQIS